MIVTARTLYLLGACLVMSVSACVTEPQCDICMTSADIVGTVTADGQPLAEAIVNADVSIGACDGPWFPSADGPVVTSVLGSYRVRVAVPAAPGVRCVIVRVTPPGGSGLPSRTDTVPALRFRPEWTGTAVRDSARADFALVTVP